MTDLEKIAWACVEAYFEKASGAGPKPSSWAGMADFQKEVAMSQARAAVEAMRELPPEIVELAEEIRAKNLGGITFWGAYLDAILNEKR